jgi:ABC-2 type transport system permease protein
VTHAAALVAAREDGVLERWRAAPLPAWCHFAGRGAATVVIAMAGGAATLLAGCILDGVRPGVDGTACALLDLGLGAMAWASVGTAVTAAIPSVQAVWPLLGATYVPIVLLSGGAGSIVLPGGLASLVGLLPARPVVDAATRAMRHLPGQTPLPTARDLAILLAWTAVGLIASRRWFRRQPVR